MKIDILCRKYGLPEGLAGILKESHIDRLYPPQEEAIAKGALEGKNMVLAIPTASGKTLVAELAMLKSILEGEGRCLYIVPLRALAWEKYEDFKRKYQGLGIRVGIATGDYDLANPQLAHYQIIVATSEKVDSLLRHRAPWLEQGLATVVADEVHLINDPGRGPTLEILITRLKQINPNIQLLALSATIRNPQDIARWLEAELVTSSWRPVPLKQGVYYERRIRFDDETTLPTRANISEDISALAVDTVSDGGQVLIFVNTRRSTQAVAKFTAKHIHPLLTKGDKQRLQQVAESIKGALGEPTDICRRLAHCVEQGTAFHHAGLHHAQRKAVEQGFRENLIKIITATPTLAAGVDLPTRRTIIRDYKRYQSQRGLQPISVLEIKQMAGRAGRPKYDKYGEAVLIAKSFDESEELFTAYISAEPEPISSQLASESALRTHVLSSIAAGYVTTLEGMLDFLKASFWGYQYGVTGITAIVERILLFLEEEEMIKTRGEKYITTSFGETVSKLYLDPLSGVVLRQGLMKTKERDISTLGMLHLIASTPDMDNLMLRRSDYQSLELFINDRKNDFLTSPLHYWDEEYKDFLAEVKTGLMLETWIDEIAEDKIHQIFGVGAGDIRRLVNLARWLIYSTYKIAKLFKLKEILPLLIEIDRRMQYGVKEELLELISLRGIGRMRGRSLYAAGYKTISSLKKAPLKKLTRIPYIGSEIAGSIKKQIAESNLKR